MKEDLPFAHFSILVLLLFIAVNLLLLDVKVFYGKNPLQKFLPQENPPVSTFEQKSDNTQPSNLANSQCPLGCLDLINLATLAGNLTSEEKIGAPQNLTPSPPNTSTQTSSNSSVAKEYFIPLGSGQTSKSSWEDIVATETIINPATYGTFKEAYFTVSLQNPTQNGQVEAQLYNVTDNYPVYGSHLVMNGPKEQTLTSSKFSLPKEAKLYRVQLKSTLGYDAVLENARLKLLAY